MPDRPVTVRLSLVALGLTLLLLADLPATWAGGAVVAAQGDETAILVEPAAAVACTSGFGDTDSKAALALHGVALTSRGALAVGFSRAGEDDDFGQRRPASVYNAGDAWERVTASSPGVEDGLVAVTAADGGTAWAVGFTTIGGQTMPLAMRWNGRAWGIDRPRPNTSLASLFTDVAMTGANPLAVGYRMTAAGGSEPIAARRDRTRWVYVSPRTGKRESVSLTGVAPDGRGGLWVVGHGGPGTEIGPVIYRRDDARWTRIKAPHLRGEAVLADVVASAADDAWAVGYQHVGGSTLPLVLRWDGRTWTRVEAPDFGSPEVVLTAVAAPRTGGIWVVGAAWESALESHEAVAAWWDGQAWNEVAGPEGGTELHDVAGSLDTDGWAVGRSGLLSSTARVCLPAQSGIFGSSEPSPQPPPADELASQETGTLAAGVAGSGQDDRTSAAPTTNLAARRSGKDRPRSRAKAKATPKRGSSGLPTARPDARLVARDMAEEAGIAEQTATYGAVVADFDGDGADDLFIGRHGRGGRLVLARDGGLVDHAPMDPPDIDRHGCTAADVDGSGLPDLYCAIGGKRGSGLKSNELWLDPGGPAPLQVAVEHGLSDPTGRGRRAVFLESEGSDVVDLVVTNSPTRVDGLPSLSRLMRTQGDGLFVSRPRTGFAARLGSLAVQDADYDGDGREDLLLVTGGLQAPRQQGTRLYRNTPRGLVEVTRQMRVRSIGEIDAELVDLDGDAKLDLVQLSPARLRVSRLVGGRFRPVYERRLTYGRAISGGDANGDGRDDLYIVRANGERNIDDVMLINRDGGSAWSSLAIPQAATGRGDEAVAIDYDGNGLEDFVVLNGNNARGPIQLIAFYEQPATVGP